MKNNRIAIIGSGFSGLASAALLAQKGYEVHIYEKNDQAEWKVTLIPFSSKDSP